MVWVGKDLKDHESPTLLNPRHRQGYQPPHLILDQSAQGPIQPGFEHLQEWGIHNLSGQPVSAPYHSHSKELFPDIQLKPSLLQFQIISPCPVVMYSFNKDVSTRLSLLKAEQTQPP